MLTSDHDKSLRHFNQEPRYWWRPRNLLCAGVVLGFIITVALAFTEIHDYPPVVIRGKPVAFFAWDTSGTQGIPWRLYWSGLLVDVVVWTALPLFPMGLVFTPVVLYRTRRLREGHCAQCGYNLTGNVSGIYPECGRPVTQHWVPRFRQRISPLCLPALGAGALLLLEFNMDVSREYLTCPNCGARCQQHRFEFFGHELYRICSVDEGPISRAIQAHQGARCRHTAWELYDGYWSTLRLRAAGSGGGINRYIWTANLDSESCIWQYIGDRAEESPAFLEDLVRAVQRPREEVSEAFLRSMLNDFWNEPYSECAPSSD